MKFADIPGHSDIKRDLAQMVDSGRLPHALLLEGPEGCGKFALARALAQYIQCDNRHDGDSCGTCPACRQHQAHQFIDTLYSFPVAKKNSKPTISDDFRQEFNTFMDQNPFMDFDRWPAMLDNTNAQPKFYVEEGNELIRRLSYTAHSARYKSVLMWLPERMNEDTANKMLKIVEEPYPDTLFIMTSDNPREILPTIYSRVQRIKVHRYSDAEVAAYISNVTSLDPAAAMRVAVLAQGSINRALALSAMHDDTDKYLEWFKSLMRNAYKRDVRALKDWSVEVAAEKREGILRFLAYCSRMIRENFINNLHDPRLNVMTDRENEFSIRFSPFINEKNATDLFQTINDAATDIAANANAKIVLFDITITVILLLIKK